MRYDCMRTFNACDFHRVDQHSGEAEWYFLRELLAVHRDLETIAEVYVGYLS